MRKNLSENTWSLTFCDPYRHCQRTIPAQIPGNVLGDLQRANLIPDPFFGNNSDQLRPYEFIDWEYRTEFTVPQLQEREDLQLTFEGIDTFAEIRVNGKLLGSSDNMVIVHSFRLDPAFLKEGANELTVYIRSTVNEARKYQRPPYSRAMPYCYEGLFLRRPMHTYGWDIAPRLVGAGLWREVYLETVKPERWTDLYLATIEASEKKSQLNLSWNFVSDLSSLIGYKAKITLECKDRKFEKSFPLYFTTGNFVFEMPDVYLWNPAGSGDAALYHVTLELIRDQKTVDTRCWKTGIRTVELRYAEQDENHKNGEFVFIVNGRKIFIKGSNWVPANALHGEKRERILQSLQLFTELGCNMIRCWGGNVYEDETFFDYCDEHGLLVWQDFMFACEVAPQDSRFQEKVRQEAEAVICRLRNHASLALWCGDNECDQPFFYSTLHKKLMPSMNKITREVLPNTVALFDGTRDYLPSSPYLSDRLKQQNNMQGSPEQHLWGLRDYKADFYKNNRAVFASEIGCLGLPCLETIRKFIPENELNDRTGYAWLCHASQQFGELKGPFAWRNKLVMQLVQKFWGTIPEDLEKLIPYSQIVQAESLKYFIELFRAKKWQKTGILWWNAIDCWPQFSDAVVDYFYRRKLAFYYIRHAHAPFTMILSDPEVWSCRLTAVNDTMTGCSGSYKVSDLSTGEVLAKGSFEVEANSACEAAQIPVDQSKQSMLLIEWDINGVTGYNHYLLGNAPFHFEEYANWFQQLHEKIYCHYGVNAEFLHQL